MVSKINKLPLKDVLAAMDMNAKNVWDELSDDERKQVSFYLLNRYASAVKGSKQDKELQILKTNQYYNKNFCYIFLSFFFRGKLLSISLIRYVRPLSWSKSSSS